MVTQVDGNTDSQCPVTSHAAIKILGELGVLSRKVRMELLRPLVPKPEPSALYAVSSSMRCLQALAEALAFQAESAQAPQQEAAAGQARALLNGLLPCLKAFYLDENNVELVLSILRVVSTAAVAARAMPHELSGTPFQASNDPATLSVMFREVSNSVLQAQSEKVVSFA